MKNNTKTLSSTTKPRKRTTTRKNRKTNRTRSKNQESVPLVQPLLVKRKNTTESTRPKKYQKVKGADPVDALRKVTLDQKFQEKTTEERLRDGLQRQLDYLLVKDSNLFDFDPFVSNINEEGPQTPVRLPKKRQRKKQQNKDKSSFVTESDIEESSENSVVTMQNLNDQNITTNHKILSEKLILPSCLNGKIRLSLEDYETAEKDAKTTLEIVKLQKQNLWNPKLIPKIPFPPRPKTQWDYVLEEMIWMANDFKQERRVKIFHANKFSHLAARKFDERLLLEERKKQEKFIEIKKLASEISKKVLEFWSDINTLRSLNSKSLNENTNNNHLQLTSIKQENENSATSSDNDSSIHIKQESNEFIKFESIILHIIKQNYEIMINNSNLLLIERNKSLNILDENFLQGNLRNYQIDCIHWLVSMYNKKLNAILADEKGLGKSIEIIGFLGYLASEKFGILGPHLIIAPSNEIQSWEYNFNKWCPYLNIQTYCGTKKERKKKRKSWTDHNLNICITSYNIFTKESKVFMKRKWFYCILDDFDNISNLHTERWKILLNIQSQYRLLLTNQSIQNIKTDLLSIINFLFPKTCLHQILIETANANHNNDIIMTQAKQDELIQSLKINSSLNKTNQNLIDQISHFQLRRYKKDILQQFPKKETITLHCNLSDRQINLYNNLISELNFNELLLTGNYFEIVKNIRSLNKICNHPFIYENYVFSSPFYNSPLSYTIPSLIWNNKNESTNNVLSNGFINYSLIEMEENINSYNNKDIKELMKVPNEIIKLINIQKNQEENDFSEMERNFSNFFNLSIEEINSNNNLSLSSSISMNPSQFDLTNFNENKREKRKINEEIQIIEQICYINKIKTHRKPIYGYSIRKMIEISPKIIPKCKILNSNQYFTYSDILYNNLILTSEERFQSMLPIINHFHCFKQSVLSKSINIKTSQIIMNKISLSNYKNHFNSCNILSSTFFNSIKTPDKHFIQYQSGKLKKLSKLLKKLKENHHKVLLFSHLTSMLDYTEIILKLHCFNYLRVDFNKKSNKIYQNYYNSFCFLLSTRIGASGLFLNSIDADTIIFLDFDWNFSILSKLYENIIDKLSNSHPIQIYNFSSLNTMEEAIFPSSGSNHHEISSSTQYFNSILQYFIKNNENIHINISDKQLGLIMNEMEDEFDKHSLFQLKNEIKIQNAEFCDDPLNIFASMEYKDPDSVLSQLTNIQK